MIEEELKRGIVAILNAEKEIVGTGFLIDRTTVYTCLHVVYEAHSEPGKTVLVQFHCNGSIQTSFVDEKSWSPIETYDVAILQLKQEPPDCLQVLPVGIPEISPGHEFFTFGYATIGPVSGISARGQIIDLVQNKHLVQLDSGQIAQGMSGAPVFDLSQNRVVGMVRFGKIEQPRERNAFTTLATSTDVISKICQLIDPETNPENIQVEKLGLYLQCGLEEVEKSYRLMDQPYLNPDECQDVHNCMKMAWDVYLFHFYKILGETSSNCFSKAKATLLASADVNFEHISRLLIEILDYKDICLDSTTYAQNKRVMIFRSIGDMQSLVKDIQRNFLNPSTF